MSARALLVRLHRWAGLALGLHWALLALTGLILVLHRDIESLWVGDAGAIDDGRLIGASLAAARAAAPDRAVKRVAVHNRGHASAKVVLQPVDGQATILLVDVARARAVARAPADGALRGAGGFGFLGFVYKLHHTLQAGHRGELLVSLSGAFLLLTAGGGLWLAWPKRGSWRRLLWPPLKGPSAAKLFLFHRAAGFIVAPLLVVSAVTGAGMIWSQEIRAAIAPAAAKPSAAEPARGRPMISPARAVALAKAQFPGAAFTLVELPASTTGLYEVRLRQPVELRAIFGTTSVLVDPYAARIVWAYDAARAPALDRVLDSLFAIHNGEAIGTAGRALVAFGGAGLAAAALAGVFAWIARRARRRTARAVGA